MRIQRGLCSLWRLFADGYRGIDPNAGEAPQVPTAIVNDGRWIPEPTSAGCSWYEITGGVDMVSLRGYGR